MGVAVQSDDTFHPPTRTEDLAADEPGGERQYQPRGTPEDRRLQDSDRPFGQRRPRCPRTGQVEDGRDAGHDDDAVGGGAGFEGELAIEAPIEHGGTDGSLDHRQQATRANPRFWVVPSTTQGPLINCGSMLPVGAPPRRYTVLCAGTRRRKRSP